MKTSAGRCTLGGVLFAAISGCGPAPDIAASAGDGFDEDASEIIGGSNAGYLRGQVQVRYSGHFCTGSLVARRWVLTAKHCANKPGEDVATGSFEWGKGAIHGIKRWV